MLWIVTYLASIKHNSMTGNLFLSLRNCFMAKISSPLIFAVTFEIMRGLVFTLLWLINK